MKSYPPQNEQDLCVACGFCCDNTLFEYASISNDDELFGHFEETRFELEKKEYFKLPCPHFDGKCSIYDQDKPGICGQFRCKLLKSFDDGEFSKEKALEIINNAKTLRTEIFEIYRTTVSQEPATYRKILGFVNEPREEKSEAFKILQAKTNLLSLLLIRYFKSKETFDEFLTLPEEES